jgi:hypothetical protein
MCSFWPSPPSAPRVDLQVRPRRDDIREVNQRPAGRVLAAIAAVGMVMATGIVAGFIATRPSPCCGDEVPFASIYREPLSRLDVVLTAGDGHAFAVIAQDPLLRRPEVLRDPAELSYRSQRPVWGYLTWAGSLGQAELTGWVLVVLTVLACGFACAVAAVFLVERGRSAWWALFVPLVGFESLTELTPELFAVALLGSGILLWRSDRRVAAVVVLSLTALTRETMLLGVGVLACWELLRAPGSLVVRVRRALPLAIPFAAYAAWITLLRVHLGNWPFNRSNDRLGLPGSGLLRGLEYLEQTDTILWWVGVGVVMSIALLVWARRDLLAWVALAFAAFGSLLGPDVWITNAGYQRALVPLFYIAPIALLGALPSLCRADVVAGTGIDAHHADPASRGEEPSTAGQGIERDERDHRPVVALREH